MIKRCQPKEKVQLSKFDRTRYVLQDGMRVDEAASGPMLFGWLWVTNWDAQPGMAAFCLVLPLPHGTPAQEVLPWTEGICRPMRGQRVLHRRSARD